MALTTTQVSQLYVALFGRASEGEGNKNWVNHNKNMIDTAALMLDTDAAENYFGEAGKTNYGFVEVIYKNTLGFDNAAQIAAWAANLDNGMSRAELVTRLLEEALSSKYAGGTPQNQLINRIDVSDYMANNVETVAAENVASTQFQSLVHPNGKLVVTDDKSTVSSAKSAIDEISGGTVIDGETFTLTRGADNLTGTADNDTFTATFGSATATDNTLTTVDVVDGKAGNDVLNVTALGAAAANLGQISNIETVNVRDVFGSTVNALLAEDLKAVNFTNTIAAQTSTVNNLNSLDTVVGLSGKGNLTVTYTAGVANGTADTAKVKLTDVGSATAASTVNVSNTNTIEALELTSTGANYAVITGGTGLASVTVDGSGDLTVGTALVGVGTNSALTYDASAATGKQAITFGAGAITVTGGTADDTFNFGTTLGNTDTIDGGAGNDKLVFEIGTAVAINPTISNVETLDVKFTEDGILNASKVTGATTLDVEVVNGKKVTVTNLAATVQTVNFDKDGAADTSGAVALGYASGAAADVTLNIGEIDTGKTGTTQNKGDDIKLGATTLTNVEKVTINSVRDADNTAAVTNTFTSVDVGTAKELTITTSDKANLGTGNLTTASVTTLALNADQGDLNVGNIVSLDKLTSLTMTTANKADLTVGNMATTAAAGALETISITTGAESTVNVGTINAIKGTGTATAASALKNVSIDLGNKATVAAAGLGAITALGNNGTTAAGAALESYSVKTGTLEGNYAIGGIAAYTIDEVSIDVAAQDVARTLTVTEITANKTLTQVNVAAAKNATVDITVNGDSASSADKLTIGTITAAGEGNFVLKGLNTDIDTIGTIDASAIKGTTDIAASTLAGSAGINILIGEGGSTLVAGSNKADIITAGKGVDKIQGGAGQDSIDLSKGVDVVDTINYAESGAANVDTVTGFKAGEDKVAFSYTDTDFGTHTLSTISGTDINAATVVDVTVAVDATVTAADTSNLIFFSNIAATSFATAIGAGSVINTTTTNTAGLAATEGVAAVYFDSTNAQAVYGYILDSDSAGTALTSADTFVEVARVGMSSTDYTLANIDASFTFIA